MILSVTALALGAATSAAAVPDGSKLRPGDSCYVTTVDGKPNATILRNVVPTTEGGKPAWLVILNSQFTKSRFDARMTLQFADLRPVEVVEGDTTIRYSDRHVFARTDDLVTVDRDLPEPVWEQLGIELVITALPLADGAHFELPVYGGLEPGTAIFDVTGSAVADTPEGKVDAWRVVKRSAGDLPTTYLIAKSDRRLLEIRVDTVVSRLGGDCSKLMK